MGLLHLFVFAMRNFQNLPVFEVQLLARKWHKDYQLMNLKYQVIMTKEIGGTFQVSVITTNLPLQSTLSKNQRLWE